MKHYHFNPVVPMVWGATIALAGSLLVKGIQTVAFGVRFPEHQVFNLLALILLCWFITGARELAAIRIFARHTRRVASSIFSRMAKFATRAAEAAALFFSANNHFNRPQTEP